MIMKKILNSLFVIVASMVTFAGCQKEENNAPASQTKTVEFFANSIETKTAFGAPEGKSYPTLWTANDSEIKLSLNYVSPKDVAVIPASDYTSAKFSAEISDDESGSYTFYALSPSTAFNSFNSASKYLSANIPTAQTPLATSVDEKAQILYSISDTFETMPGSVNLNFKHFTAYGKLSFKNLALGDAQVTSVAITSSVKFAGRWNYVVETDVFEENSGASEITLNTNSTENLWFACAPVDMDGQTLTFTVNTDKGPLSKTVTLTNKKFEAGQIATMVVDMAGIEFAQSKVYELVTSVDVLTPESEIIIVAAASNFALSTAQNGNNRGQAAITKSSDKPTISDPGAGVQVIVLEEGTVDGTFAFNVANGYLFAPTGGNYLRTTNTLNANASWNISITSAGIATVKAEVSSKNWMRYNSNNSIFSCYDSGQLDICIYKRQGTGIAPLPKLTAPVVTAELSEDETGIDVSWTLVENATSYEVSCTGQADVTVSEDATSYSFADLASGSYQITVTAMADGYKSAKSNTVSVVIPAVGGGENSGEEVTITLTLNRATTGSSSTSYVKNATNFTYDGISYVVANWNPNSLQIRGNKTPANNNLQNADGSDRNFMLRNTTPIPGRIKSIRITYTEGTIVNSKTYAAVGASEITNQTTSGSIAATAETNAVSWTFADGGSYFAIGMISGGTSGTTKVGTVTIVYEAN